MVDEIIIRQPDPEPYVQSGMEAIRNAEEAVIQNIEDKELAGSIADNLRTAIGRINMEFDGTKENPGPVALQHRAWKAGVALREKAVGGFQKALDMWVQKARKFDYDVEQKRQAEARKAEALAQKKAQEERDRQIAEAKKLGDRETVENLKEAPIVVQAAAPKTPEVTKVDGFRRSNPIWDWELVNIDKVERKYMTIDKKNVDALVKKLGPKAGIAGINVYDARSRGAE